MNRSKKTFRKSKKINRSKKNKKVNKSNKNKNIKRVGGCECGNTMHGGNLPPSQYYYALNDHNNDPISPSNIVDARQQPNLTGGSRKNKKRKMKGGMNGTSFLSTLTDPIFNTSSMMNPILSYGTVAGGLSASNLLTGSPDVDNSNTTQLSNINIENNHMV